MRQPFSTGFLLIIVALLAIIVWGSTRKSRMGHLRRVVVMFLSGGVVFPHALTEDDDFSQNDAEKGAGVKVKSRAKAEGGIPNSEVSHRERAELAG